MRLSCIITVTDTASIQLFLSLLHDSLKTDFQYFPVFNCYMSYTIVKIVPRCKNIVFNCLDCFRCHIGSCKFTGCFPFPVLICLLKFGFGLLSNLKRIRSSGRNCIQFSFQPLIRELRKCLTSPRRNRTASDNQFIVTDNDRNIMKNMRKSLCSACDDRFSFCFLIRFCDQLCSG